MGFIKKTKGSIISDYLVLAENVANLQAQLMYDVALYEDYLEVKGPIGASKKRKNSVKLKYEQITDINYGLETEIITKNKSTIGRSVAGGLLFGGPGAIVGAISSTKDKKKKVSKYMLIISYKSSSGDDAFISFEDNNPLKGVKLVAKLNEICKIEEPPSSPPPEYL